LPIEIAKKGRITQLVTVIHIGSTRQFLLQLVHVLNVMTMVQRRFLG
jgi:hypothetical protein